VELLANTAEFMCWPDLIKGMLTEMLRYLFPEKRLSSRLFLTVQSDQVRILTDASRPDGVGTVTQEEKEKFTEIKERLRVQLEYQLTNFRHYTVS
jgi:hypothetical protein